MFDSNDLRVYLLTFFSSSKFCFLLNVQLNRKIQKNYKFKSKLLYTHRLKHLAQIEL